MATPVPVVSMMYFLVVSPPNTLVMVRPDFAATSRKSTTGTGALCVCAPARCDDAPRTANQSRQDLGFKPNNRNLMTECMVWRARGSRQQLSENKRNQP